MKITVQIGAGVGNMLMKTPALVAMKNAGHDVQVLMRPTAKNTDVAALFQCFGKIREFDNNFTGFRADNFDKLWVQDNDFTFVDYWWHAGVHDPNYVFPNRFGGYLQSQPKMNVPEWLGFLTWINECSRLDLNISSAPYCGPLKVKGPNEPYITMCVGGKEEFRIQRGWRLLFEELPIDMKIVLVGSRDDLILDAYDMEARVVDLRGIGLVETASWIKHSIAFLGAASGLIWLSAACGTPTFCFWGPDNAVKNGGPWIEGIVPDCAEHCYRIGIMSKCTKDVRMCTSPENMRKAIEWTKERLASWQK